LADRIAEIHAECKSKGAVVTNVPDWKPDDGSSARIITINVDAKTLANVQKEGHADEFTVFCDEAERLGGDNTAPSPMRYMALAVGF
jgi:hypothetical protein